MIYNFKNDYTEGVHPRILDALKQTNLEQHEGYGEDRYCREAIQLLRHKIQNPSADIHFVSGGTQTNAIVIPSVLKSYESVISTFTGHINYGGPQSLNSFNAQISSKSVFKKKIKNRKHYQVWPYFLCARRA